MNKIKPYFITNSLEQLISLLDNGAFFVGGCVRDFLMHRPIGDIDMATPLTPDEVQQRLEKTNIRIIPTGIKHGTLTLLLSDGQKVEITSFRQDIKTDGRHATVQFGTDIKQDALRRDLTINALYMDKTGQLTDFVGGLKDLKKKRIRFIGDANKRIQEDALRILRFYRFYGLFIGSVPDKSAIAACRCHKNLLKNISIERIKDEVFKLLSHPIPYKALHLMKQSGILYQIFKNPVKLQSIRHLLLQERKAGFQASPLFRCWILNEKKDLPFKLSNAEKKQITLWQQAEQKPFKTQRDFLAILFLYGKDTLINMLLMKKKNLNFSSFRYIQQLQAPVCPFTPTDIMNHFNLTGKDISQKYEEAVRFWIKNNFCKKDIVFNALLR